MLFIFAVKFRTGQYLHFFDTGYKAKVLSKNVKQCSISCRTLVARYVSLNILSEETFTVRQCFSPYVGL